MEQDRVIGEIARRNGVKLDPHDPVLMISTLLDLHAADHDDLTRTLPALVDRLLGRHVLIYAMIFALALAAAAFTAGWLARGEPPPFVCGELHGGTVCWYWPKEPTH